MSEQFQNEIEKILKKQTSEDQIFSEARLRYARELERISQEHTNGGISENEWLRQKTKTFLYFTSIPVIRKLMNKSQMNSKPIYNS